MRSYARSSVAGAASLVLVCLSASAVAAHSTQGLLTLDAVRGREPLTVEVRARLVYVNDGHPASNGAVTVEALESSGAAVPPQPMAREGDGVYTAVMVLPTPGAWTLRAAASDPDASAEVAFEAEPSPTTTTTPVATRSRPRGVTVAQWAAYCTHATELDVAMQAIDDQVRFDADVIETRHADRMQKAADRLHRVGTKIGKRNERVGDSIKGLARAVTQVRARYVRTGEFRSRPVSIASAELPEC
jgi:hypothetical protein